MRIARHFTSVLVVLALSAVVQASPEPGRGSDSHQGTQPAVGLVDITRLESTAADIERQATGLRRTDSTLAADVMKSLTDLREEVTYLRVKLRRDGSVTRAEYTDVRDRLETLRVKAGLSSNSRDAAAAAAGQKVYAQPVLSGGAAERVYTVPVGTELDIRLQTPLNSGTARVEQRFEATTVLDLMNGADVVVPAGSVIRGFVSSVKAAGKVDRQGSLTLSFDEIIIDQRPDRLRASVVRALDPKVGDDVSRIGAGAAVGAIIGGILGGGKGALLGVLVGGGGTIASTEGSDVNLPTGNLLRIRLDQRLDVIR